MKRLLLYAGVAWVLLICFVGILSVITRWRALDDWCAKQLED